MLRGIGRTVLNASLVRSVAPRTPAVSLATRSFTSCQILRNGKDEGKAVIGDIIIQNDKELADGRFEKKLENGQTVIYDPNFSTKIEDPELIKEQEQINKEIDIEPEFLRGLKVEDIENDEFLEVEEDFEEVPWYMRGDEASELDQPIFKAEIPEIPKGAPESLEPLLKFCSDKLGLDDLKIFDIRGRDDIPVSSYIDFMVITTGKSEKHNQKATDELATYIKHTLDSVPYVEGLLKANSVKRQKRRIKRNVRKGGIADNEFGVGPNSWVMVDPQTDDMVIHILTPERRENVNLEYLWCKPEEKELYKPKEYARVMEDVDDIFFGLQRRNYSTKIETDLSAKVLQQFEIGDEEGLNESLKELIHQNDASLKVLKSIMNTIESLPVHQAIEELSCLANKYTRFLDAAFPVLPTSEYWQTRYQLFSTLNKILPDVYRIYLLTYVLMTQVASGEAITKDQYKQYISDLISTPQFGTDLIETRELMNKVFEIKFESLREIIRIMRLQGNLEVDNDFIKDMLLLSSQYTTGDKEGPIAVSKYFRIIIDLYQNDVKFNNDVIYLALNTLARAHDPSFWSFWDQLGTYETDLKSVSYDSRPWNILIKVVKDSKHGKLIDDFMIQQTPVLISNKIELDEEMQHDILSIIQQHGGDAGVYSELVTYIQSK